MSQLTWHAKWSKCTRSWYARGFIPSYLRERFPNQSPLPYLHRFITNAPDDMDVDHENHDTLNCRRGNMRVCPRKHNTQSRRMRSDNVAEAKGVNMQHASRFRARIYVDGRNVHLGYFKTADAAHQAYVDAAKKYFGEFAYAG